ncbi:MAG TPA: GNAT family N-acetyltransferase [Baekduia sp.]|nr:GNAT family N-acetyltransferase [Baekduia sp.]
MHAAEMPELSMRDWVRLTGREPAPFGPASDGIVWRPKDRHVGVWDGDELIAAAGVVVAEVEVAGAAFDVVGVGGLVVRPEYRGRHLMPLVADPVGRMAEAAGPDRAMIFCDERLVRVYEGRGYTRIADPVWVDQPEGRIEMPIPAMWRPLRPGATWPRGTVQVRGEPF